MPKHFDRQVDKIKRMIVTLGTLAEEAVGEAITAWEKRDADLAQRVIDAEDRIDQLEVEIEEECLHTLALYQPVAFDLRFIVSILKINSDLERIGDLAANVAEQARFLASEARLDSLPFDLPGMANTVRSMLKESLDALVHTNVEQARRVVDMDEEVDAIHRRMYDKVEQAILEKPQLIQQYIHLLNISRQLERLADHVVNIAEDVMYMVAGEIPRHQRRSAPASD